MTSALRVTVFDYGAGNLHSLVKALEMPDTAVHIESDPARLVHETDAVILPGVGAFAPAAERLAPALASVRDALANGLPCLGICLGMQLLFDRSTEGPGNGLGVFAGDVSRFRAKRVPQIGWNTLECVSDSEPDTLLLKSNLRMAWFANSFVARPTAVSECQVVAYSQHEGDRFPAIVRRGHVVGAQFHPEKSSTEGVQFVRAFLDESREARK